MNISNFVYLSLIFGLCFCVKTSQAQIKIGDNHETIQASSLLELESSNKGILIPRMNTVQRNLISAAADFSPTLSNGLFIFNTDNNQFEFWSSSNSAWESIGGVQTLSLSGQNLSISGGNTVGLPVQTLSIAGQALSITGGNTVPIPDEQTLSLSGQDLTISGGNTITLPIGSAVDSQDLSLSGNILSLTNDPTNIDLSAFLDNTDSQILSLSGQDLTISGGNTITLPSGGTAAFATISNLTNNSPGDYANDDFLFGSPQLNDDANANHQSRFFFDKSKGAFRAGNTVGNGWDDANRGVYSTAMGNTTAASGSMATALGGFTNASATASTAIGFNTTADANYSTALGSYVSCNGMEGAFIIGDYLFPPPSVTNSSAPAEMTMRFSGGYRLFSNAGLTSGVTLAAGGGAWTTISDRNKKENFKALDAEEVLQRLVQLPVMEWNYKSQAANIRHVGPVAQDFYAAFGLGLSDTTITTSDIDGINMLAIKALANKTSQLELKNQELSEKSKALELALDRIEALEAKNQQLTSQQANNQKQILQIHQILEQNGLLEQGSSLRN